MTKDLWAHQVKGIQGVLDLAADGERRICLTSPTGGGKTRMILELIDAFRRMGLGALLLTHRKMLFEQLCTVLESSGVSFGRRAAGYDTNLLEPVQIAMVQSELTALRKGRRERHACGLLIVDEAHVNASPSIAAMVSDYVSDGVTVVWVTATPISLGHVADKLVVAGTTPELIDAGVLVVPRTFAPDEPDMRAFKCNPTTGAYSEQDCAAAMRSRTIFGRVFDHWKLYNPDALPALLFAPDVAGSIYFAEQFQSRGVPTAHIDGKEIWIKGKRYETTPQLRQEVLDMSRLREVRVLCNRYVLREGIDCPWLYHGIFATPFGSPQSYIQSGGRLLRSHPGLANVIIQDHGGNYWRHGSLREGRDWDMHVTGYQMRRERAERYRNNNASENPLDNPDALEPLSCFQCGHVRLWGSQCPECGYRATKRSRKVIQASGRLVEVTGHVHKPHRQCNASSSLKSRWIKCYHRCKRSGRTFAQAEGLFVYENYIWPNRSWPLMPTDSWDWARKVKDVPYGNLVPQERD